MDPHFEPVNTNLSYDQAKSLFDAHVKDPGVRKHCRASEQIMRGLAKYFGQDEEQWGILGLLHDIDFDKTKDDPVNHCVLAISILKDAGVSSEAIDVICSHAWGSECGGGNVAGKKRTRNIEHALVAAETVTGLIYAAALMNPEKKLANVKVKSLKKKYKSKAFARNCNREFIAEIENTGVELNGFFDIAIKAMQEISDELGL
ncbi:MAG: HDIG domain-containing protein [Deltaproteobacteria bacterium]|nr:HDIG domain-containing protein [Deltaproteobacteria bacterium]MBW1792834.1 HDIG domain-containing protein [Deltaproteobacteria bacterium]MBW2329634.1 HDIG domain-containing protein [Deltaproteobacteria bacterium]